MNSQTPITDNADKHYTKVTKLNGGYEEEWVYSSLDRDLEEQLAAANARATEALEIARELKGNSSHRKSCAFVGGYGYCDCGLHKAFQRLEALEKGVGR